MEKTSTVTSEVMSIAISLKPKDMDEWNIHLQNKFRAQLLKVVLKRFEVIDNKCVDVVGKIPSKSKE